MNTQEIIENNKLIANYSDPEWKNRVDLEWQDIEDYLPSYQLYFDYLMPVIEQIQNSGCIVEINYALVVTCRICYLGKNKNDKAINFYGDNNGGKEPIIAIYECVVEFLKYLENERIT